MEQDRREVRRKWPRGMNGEYKWTDGRWEEAKRGDGRTGKVVKRQEDRENEKEMVDGWREGGEGLQGGIS